MGDLNPLLVKTLGFHLTSGGVECMQSYFTLVAQCVT